MDEKQPDRDFTGEPSQAPEYVGDVWDKIAHGEEVDRQDNFSNDEERAQWVALRDAEHALQALREERESLISRLQEGEGIDSAQIRHIGELLLEAEADLQALRQSQGLPPEQE